VLRNTNFRPRFFDPAAKKAGLPGLTPHELPHTTASLAIAAGANVKTVQQMLGHASAAMTLDIDAGLFADDLDAVADQLDRAFARTNADQMWSSRRLDRAIRPCCPLIFHQDRRLARPNSLRAAYRNRTDDLRIASRKRGSDGGGVVLEGH
jgi:hypothetical protein